MEYRYPVGLFGLHIMIALVFGVISFSNSLIAGRANPFSMTDKIGFIKLIMK